MGAVHVALSSDGTRHKRDGAVVCSPSRKYCVCAWLEVFLRICCCGLCCVWDYAVTTVCARVRLLPGPATMDTYVLSAAAMEASVLQGRRFAAERRYDAWEVGQPIEPIIGDMKQHDYDIVLGAKSKARTGTIPLAAHRSP